MPTRTAQVSGGASSRGLSEDKPPKRPAPAKRTAKSISTAKSRVANKTVEKPSSQAARGAALRSIWKGAISFGMVTIPVRMVPATAEKDLAFHLLHARCSTRLKQIRWCPTCKKEVEWNDTVRGYEYAKGEYVRLTEEDFDKIPGPSKHTIEISAFVSLEDIDPIYFEKSYYLDPEPIAAKSYTLLVTALEMKKLTSIARIAIRDRERLCALRAVDGALVLETLYYADELREHSTTTRADVSDRELDMALKLIDFLTQDFQPGKYHDEYRDAVLEIIQAKLQGADVVRPPVPRNDKIINLMDALRASLSAAQSRKGALPADVVSKPRLVRKSA